jgi:hypothetical protein
MMDAKLIVIYKTENTDIALITYRLEINVSTNAFEYTYKYINKLRCFDD